MSSITKKRCSYCTRFFASFRCNAPGECDCPPCQGICRCALYVIADARELADALAQDEANGGAYHRPARLLADGRHLRRVPRD